MHSRIFIAIFVLFSFLSSFAYAEDGYVGEDLGNDIYKRLDEGTYKLKKQLIENRLKGSEGRINSWVGDACSAKDGSRSRCFRSGADFTASELEGISAGDVGPIFMHLDPNNTNLTTDEAARMGGIIAGYDKELRSQVADEQKKLQSVGSIGLFTDGNKDNSSYDLMVDLENIHSVLFAKEIPYNGTENMGAAAVAGILGNAYDHPFLPLNPLDSIMNPPYANDPGVSLIPPGTGSALPVLQDGGSGCVVPTEVPVNLDPDFLRDVQSQLLVGISPASSIAFSDNGRLPENWAKVGQRNGSAGGSPGSAGAGTDSFPCSGADFFCILISMSNYTQNILGWGQASTIEKILDENFKIANKFAVSSFVQAKMTRNFFQLSLKNLDLPSMAHIGTVVSRLPPPLLNFKPGTTGGGDGESTGQKDEFNQIIVNAFEEVGLDFKRQNSLERNDESRVVNNLTELTTDSTVPKSVTDITPVKAGYIASKEMELKKWYGDSFTEDLYELHDFTLAFSKSLESLTSVIKKMHEIPKK